MIKLSDRLLVIADRINDCKTVADIGTDHGFLPIYMIDSGSCRNGIFADISMSSLDKARENWQRYIDGLSDKVKKSEVLEAAEFRAGDGLSVLKAAEADAIVIAGMGGRTIIDILSADITLTRTFGKFVLQPRNGQGVLRKWLCENGFNIVREDLVKEGIYIPEIITAMSGEGAVPEKGARDIAIPKGCCNNKDFDMRALEGDDIRWSVPPWITEASGPVNEFLERRLNKERKILYNVMLSKERKTSEEHVICDNIYYLQELLKNNGVKEKKYDE